MTEGQFYLQLIDTCVCKIDLYIFETNWRPNTIIICSSFTGVKHKETKHNSTIAITDNRNIEKLQQRGTTLEWGMVTPEGWKYIFVWQKRNPWFWCSSKLHMSQRMTKPTKWHVRPTKTQISLCIRPVWSESSMYTQYVAKDPSFLHADSEDSDQTGRMPSLIWVFAGRTCHFVVVVMAKPTKWHVRPAKTQISLGIRPNWLESLLLHSMGS